MRRFTWNRFPV